MPFSQHDQDQYGIEGVIFTPLVTREDARGSLCELWRIDEAAGSRHPSMSYISYTKPGTTRGPHEHVHQSDLFCFLVGTFALHLWDNRPTSRTYRMRRLSYVGADNPMSVLIPPGVVHAYKNVGGVQAMVVNSPNRLYKGVGRKSEVDEIRHEDDPNSPFGIEKRGPFWNEEDANNQAAAWPRQRWVCAACEGKVQVVRHEQFNKYWEHVWCETCGRTLLTDATFYTGKPPGGPIPDCEVLPY